MTINNQSVNGRFFRFCFGARSPLTSVIDRLNRQTDSVTGTTTETDTSNQSNQVQHTYPMTMIVYSELNWYGILIILLRAIVPCILAAGIVQEAAPISNKILGR